MPETITIRLPGGMLNGIHDLSKANNRSMNGQVVEELRKAIDRHSKVLKSKEGEKK